MMQVTPIGAEPLRHGYTLADLDKLTHAALIADRSLAMDHRERRDIAWSAIAEHLYAADQPPTRQELIRAGWQAIYAEVRDGRRHHGYADAQWDAGYSSAPRFAQYWWPRVVPSHEDRVVERIAVGQILTKLTDTYRDAVVALAVHDDYLRAATAMGISYKALVARVGTARRRAIGLWHEGETPHRPRRTDRRVESHSAPLATHCSRGHEWTPENTRTRRRMVRGRPKRERICRACERHRTDSRRHQSEEAADA